MKTELVRRVSRTIGRWRGWNLAVVTVLLTVCLVMPQTTESQILPSPCCAILSAGLGSTLDAGAGAGEVDRRERNRFEHGVSFSQRDGQ